MKCNVYHPEAQSLVVLEQAIDANENIYRSPHVGNVNNDELSLITGVCDMGGSVQLELVNTIRGDDRYSEPRFVKAGQQKIQLVPSRKYASSRVPETCVVSEEGLSSLMGLIPASEAYQPGVTTLQQIHNDALRRVLPDAVTITPSTEYFNGMGAEAYKLLLQEASKVVQRPLRKIDEEGKIREHPADKAVDFGDIYGQGDNALTGILPPLEAMMAAELVRKTIESNGADAQIVHVGGPDMVVYTKKEEMMSLTKAIADRVLSDLGVGCGSQIDYVVPAMSAILASGQIKLLASQIESQYDLMLAPNIDRSAA